MLLLEELIDAPDFHQALEDCTRPLVERFGLPPVAQLGVVVPDAEAAARVLEKKGCGSFFIARGSAAMWREHGQDREVNSKLGIAFHQGVMVELLEPGTGTDFYGRSLDPQGRPRVQHLGFLVRDVDKWAKKLEGRGFAPWVRGRIRTGPVKAEFYYTDAINQTGFVMEFISFRFLGVPFRPPKAFFHFMGRLEKITGKRCIDVK